MMKASQSRRMRRRHTFGSSKEMGIMYTIKWDACRVEDYRSLGGDLERTYLTEMESYDEYDKAVARFRLLDLSGEKVEMTN